MKIWIDARTYYKNDFLIRELISYLSKKHKITLYAGDYIDLGNIENVWVKYMKWSGFFYENSSFYKKLKKDKNDLVITFEKTFPLKYKKNIFKIVDTLDYILYPDFVWVWSIKKHFLLYLYKNILKTSKKIIALSKNIKYDLNEHYNISDEKIEVIDGFFSSISKPQLPWTPLINIKNKHWILWDYLISDVWIWNSKNLKKLIDALVLVNTSRDLNIIFIWDEISKNLEIRDYVISRKMQNKTFFVWNLQEKEESFYYTQSSWVIFTWTYSGFPVFLNKSLSYNSLIYSSQIDEITSILWDNWIYFSSDKTKDIVTKLNTNFLHKPDYKDIFREYTAKKFTTKLLELIK